MEGERAKERERVSVAGFLLFTMMVNTPDRSLRWPRNESMGQKVDKWWLDSKGGPIYHAPGECYWQCKNSLTLDLLLLLLLLPFGGSLLSHFGSSLLFFLVCLLFPSFLYLFRHPLRLSVSSFFFFFYKCIKISFENIIQTISKFLLHIMLRC